jgi:pyruvate-ferredoxin/flavodoxin oxidoreductase
MYGENRFKSLVKNDPEKAKALLETAGLEYNWRRSVYKQLAAMACDTGSGAKSEAKA